MLVFDLAASSVASLNTNVSVGSALENCTVCCAGLYDARSSFVTCSDSPDICVGFPLVDCTAGASAAFGSVGVGGFAARIIQVYELVFPLVDCAFSSSGGLKCNFVGCFLSGNPRCIR